ncbi:hypothetical protein [Paenibacillus polymyxa]|uniref:hypothetical protein n=1 Tax=Paenibacillus polymyxa TaxID=1406 RepID=UPI001F2B6A6B|nr:hypothetical protein [Paenibacillus polymyxa]
MLREISRTKASVKTSRSNSIKEHGMGGVEPGGFNQNIGMEGLIRALLNFQSTISETSNMTQIMNLSFQTLQRTIDNSKGNNGGEKSVSLPNSGAKSEDKEDSLKGMKSIFKGSSDGMIKEIKEKVGQFQGPAGPSFKTLLQVGSKAGLIGLAAGAAGAVAQVVGDIALDEGQKSIEEITQSDEEKKNAAADARDKNLADFTKSFKADNSGNFMVKLVSEYNQTEASLRNGVRSLFGLEPKHMGQGQADDFYDSMVTYYQKKDSTIRNRDDMNRYLEKNGISTEDAVKEWSEKSGYAKKTEKEREEIFIKNYEKKLQEEEKQKKLVKKAQKAYDEKYNKGETDSLDTDKITTQVNEKLNKVQSGHNLEILKAEMAGVRTDSTEYINLRKRQNQELKDVLNEQLKIMDRSIRNLKESMNKLDPNSDEWKEKKEDLDERREARQKMGNQFEETALQSDVDTKRMAFQSSLSGINNQLARVDSSSQGKGLVAALGMDRESKVYLDKMSEITRSRSRQLQEQLTILRSTPASGDDAVRLQQEIMNLQNNISSNNLQLKELFLSKIGIERRQLEVHSSDRNNAYLAERVKRGGAEEDSPAMRTLRVSNMKQEVYEMNALISKYKKDLNGKEPETQRKIQEQIRELTNQSLQTQLGILDEMKSSAGTFNMPEGVTAMTRYEYLTRGNTHQSYTIGSGDVVVNVTLPNVTNGVSPSQLETIGNGLGRGLAYGKAGSLRDQLLMNPTTAYRSKTS